jgi:hypothetical protein
VEGNHNHEGRLAESGGKASKYAYERMGEKTRGIADKHTAAELQDRLNENKPSYEQLSSSKVRSLQASVKARDLGGLSALQDMIAVFITRQYFEEDEIEAIFWASPQSVLTLKKYYRLLEVCMIIWIFIYLFVCLFICLFVCLLVCLFVCLSVCLFVCLFVYLFVCLFVLLFVCLFAFCLSV